jgi:hypothetical protein
VLAALESRQPARHPAELAGKTLDVALRRLLDPSSEHGESALFESLLSVVLEPLYDRIALPQIKGKKEPELKALVQELQALFGVEVEVLVAPEVPGGAMLVDFPRPQLIVESAFLKRSEGERRFLLGRSFEPLRGRYALFLRLDSRERAEVAHWLEQLLLPDGEREPQVREFAQNVSKRSAKILERAAAGRSTELDCESWLARLDELAVRAGLVACDDIGAALHSLARDGASGEGRELAFELDPIAGAPEAVAFYLSSEYDALKAAL